jgi:enolase-phosphatase E1
MPDTNTQAILLDIEGTTTPVEFVYEVLFPFARRHVGEFVRQHKYAPQVRAAVGELRQEHRADSEKGSAPPAWRDDSDDSVAESAAAYVHWLMDQDRKSTALKSLQGQVWEGGYLSGRLQGEVYSDVPPAFARWRAQGRAIYIFSSGSVLAQKLLFAHTNAGDLTGHISGYFDTSTGAKADASSYRRISAEIGVPPAEVLFLSDVVAELDAARAAGMMTALCVRPGRPEPEPATHRLVRTFDLIFPSD